MKKGQENFLWQCRSERSESGFRQFSLISAAAAHFAIDGVQNFRLAQVPMRSDEQISRSFAIKTFDDDVRIQSLDESNDDVYSLWKIKNKKRLGFKLSCQRRAANNVQVVNLDRVETEAIDRCWHGQPLFLGLVGETDDNMATEMKAAIAAALKCFDGARKVMAAIGQTQGIIINRFDPVFERHKIIARNLGKHLQDFFAHAIGPRANRQADNVGMVERFAIHAFEIGGISISVGVRLKVGDELFHAITLAHEFNSSRNLFADGMPRTSGLRRKAGDVAIRAAADSHRAIAIWAGEPSMHADFVHALTEALLQPAAVGVVKRSFFQLQSLFISQRATLKNAKEKTRRR